MAQFDPVVGISDVATGKILGGPGPGTVGAGDIGTGGPTGGDEGGNEGGEVSPALPVDPDRGPGGFRFLDFGTNPETDFFYDFLDVGGLLGDQGVTYLVTVVGGEIAQVLTIDDGGQTVQVTITPEFREHFDNVFPGGTGDPDDMVVEVPGADGPFGQDVPNPLGDFEGGLLDDVQGEPEEDGSVTRREEKVPGSGPGKPETIPEATARVIRSILTPIESLKTRGEKALGRILTSPRIIEDTYAEATRYLRETLGPHRDAIRESIRRGERLPDWLKVKLDEALEGLWEIVTLQTIPLPLPFPIVVPVWWTYFLIFYTLLVWLFLREENEEAPEIQQPIPRRPDPEEDEDEEDEEEEGPRPGDFIIPAVVPQIIPAFLGSQPDDRIQIEIDHMCLFVRWEKGLWVRVCRERFSWVLTARIAGLNYRRNIP